MWNRLGCSALASMLLAISGCSNAPASDEAAGPSALPANAESSSYVYESVQIGDRQAMSIRLLGGPDWLAADDQFVYTKRDDGGVTVLDPATGEVVNSFQITGGRCQGLGGAQDGLVWACNSAGLVQLQADSGVVRASVPVAKSAEQGHLGVGFGRVWVLQGDGSSLLGIDTDTHQPGPPIVLPIRGTDLTISSDRIWVYSGIDNAALEIDPESGTLGRRVDGLTGARSAVSVPGALWVGGSSASYRIDVATGAVTATVSGGIGYDGGISADDSSIWVRNGFLNLQRLDVQTGAVLEEISEHIGTAGGDILVAFDALWVSFYDDATLIRIPLG